MVEHRWSVALPEPTSYEAAISLALRIRDFDSDLQQFWPLKAKEFGANPGAEVLAEIDEAWRRLTWATIHELIAATGEETARIRAVLSAFPVGERGYAWANERGRLASPRSVEAKEHAYRMRLLGPDFERDGSWLVELNKAHLAGEALVKSWRDWLKAEAWAGRSTIARNHELEAAVVSAVADQLGPRQLYADWLLEQPGAAAVGELIQVATVDSENPWRSALMLDIGPGPTGRSTPFSCPAMSLEGRGPAAWRNASPSRATGGPSR